MLTDVSFVTTARRCLCCLLVIGLALCGCESSTSFSVTKDGSSKDGPPKSGDGSVGPHTLFTIQVEPTNAILELDRNQAGTQIFKAIGYFADGKSEDLSAKVTWASSNAKLGAFSGSTLQIPALTKTGAEVTKIEASLGTVLGKAQLTVVAYRKSGAKTDFFFLLPFEDKGGPKNKPLDFKTDVQNLDVFFAMDTTGSMSEEIKNLQTGLKKLVVPGIQAQIPGTQFGAGALMDFPIDPYGALPDQPFMLFQIITPTVADVQTAVDKYSNSLGKPIGKGGDGPEATMEALYQIATGKGLTGPAPTNVPPNNAGVGGVGFRKGSMPVAVAVTDVIFHAPGEVGACTLYNMKVDYGGSVASVAHNRTQTKDALKKICARVVGIAPTSGKLPECTGLADLEDFARTTSAVVPPDTWDVPARPANCAAGKCCTDLNGAGRSPGADGLCPLVFKTDQNGSGLSAAVVTGIKMLARYAPFDVSTAVEGQNTDEAGQTLPTGKTTADFVKAVTPDSFKKPAPPPKLPDPTKDATGFKNVSPGTTVTFSVQAFNDFVKPTDKARIFRAVIKVLAGGCTDLDQREVLILVPPEAIAVL